MRKFFDKLANAGRRFGRWLAGTRPVAYVWRTYDRSVITTANPLLNFCYRPKSRRAKFFNTDFGYRLLDYGWLALCVPVTAGLMLKDGLMGSGRLVGRALGFAIRGVMLVTAIAWALATVTLAMVLSCYWWLCHLIGTVELRMVVRLWCWITGRSSARFIQQNLPYARFRAFVANFTAAFVPIYAGVAQLFRRAIGDKPTWKIVQHSTDLVGRLDGPVYDWWFGETLPFETPQDGGETYGVFITDNDVEEPVSEKDQVENWFVSSGYVLIATDAPDKSDKDVFNEYMRERWANLNAAEIATDQFGRTWVVPFERQPLFRDVATDVKTHRTFADREIAWMSVEDKLQRSHSYGRHWAAALADQDADFLTNEDLVKKERAWCFSRIKGRQDLLTEHVMKGFDEFVRENSSAPVAEPTH